MPNLFQAKSTTLDITFELETENTDEPLVFTATVRPQGMSTAVVSRFTTLERRNKAGDENAGAEILEEVPRFLAGLFIPGQHTIFVDDEGTLLDTSAESLAELSIEHLMNLFGGVHKGMAAAGKASRGKPRKH